MPLLLQLLLLLAGRRRLRALLLRGGRYRGHHVPALLLLLLLLPAVGMLLLLLRRGFACHTRCCCAPLQHFCLTLASYHTCGACLKARSPLLLLLLLLLCLSINVTAVAAKGYAVLEPLLAAALLLSQLKPGEGRCHGGSAAAAGWRRQLRGEHARQLGNQPLQARAGGGTVGSSRAGKAALAQHQKQASRARDWHPSQPAYPRLTSACCLLPLPPSKVSKGTTL